MSMCVSIYTKPMVTYSPRERIRACVCVCVHARARLCTELHAERESGPSIDTGAGGAQSQGKGLPFAQRVPLGNSTPR